MFMSEVISPAERSEIERACEQLVYAYSRALDLGDTGGAADFFAENGSMARPMTPDEVIRGRETIRAALLARPKGLLTKHLATNVAIRVDSRDTASGTSNLTMIATSPGAGDQPPFLSNGPIYFGEFKDRFVREHGVWRFLERLGSIQIKFAGGSAA
jgi:SnoaL-like domain